MQTLPHNWITLKLQVVIFAHVENLSIFIANRSHCVVLIAICQIKKPDKLVLQYVDNLLSFHKRRHIFEMMFTVAFNFAKRVF